MKRSTVEKYDRASRHYDKMEALVELLFFRRFRKMAVSLVGGNTLEVGVGTGKNLPYYPPGAKVTAIDFSLGMIQKAEKKKEQLFNSSARLTEMDVEQLSFFDNTFDSSISTFVFCTVPNPHRGLSEVYRVLKHGGTAIFLEHMKSRNRLINICLFVMNIYSTYFLGTSMLRDTQYNIAAAGFSIRRVHNLLFDVVRLIVAEKV